MKKYKTMKVSISTKHLQLSPTSTRAIEKYLTKINKIIPTFEDDLVEMDLVLKEYKKRGSGGKKTELVEEEFDLPVENDIPKTSEPTYFEGTIKMILPHKPLVVRLKGLSEEEAINKGFDTLIRELQKYKGKYFTSNSEYFDHKTIRRR